MLKVKNNQIDTINSRDVAEMMDIRHSDLIRKIEGISSILNERNFALVEYFIESTYVAGNGEIRKCFEVTRKGCEMLAHKTTGEKGILFTAKYIERFHEMEQVIRDSYMISDPVARALAWAKEEEERQQLRIEAQEKQILIDEYKPKADVYDSVLDCKDNLSVGEYAKSIGLGSRRLYNILRDRGIFLSSKSKWNEPSQRYVDGGMFKIQFYPYNGQLIRKTLITEKGILWLTKNLKKNGYIE
ncbi:hypothetical protein GNF80_09965 [Clostridium perfringens]|nr:hypothetical protein [Clostridium perfringens]